MRNVGHRGRYSTSATPRWGGGAWLNAPVSKTGVPSRVPGVRIPPPPLLTTGTIAHADASFCLPTEGGFFVDAMCISAWAMWGHRTETLCSLIAHVCEMAQRLRKNTAPSGSPGFRVTSPCGVRIFTAVSVCFFRLPHCYVNRTHRRRFALHHDRDCAA